MRIRDWSSDVCSSDLSAFVKVGLSGDMGGTWFWSRILDAGKARRLYLLSERFESAAAKEFGLVDEVVEDDAIAGTVEAMSRSLASGTAREIGRAHVRTPVNNAQLVCHLLL